MRRRLRLGGDADLQRINPDRLGDILELGRAKIADRKIKPRSHLSIGIFRKTNGAGLGDALQSRGNIDAVAHQITVALLDDVAKMYAYPKINTPIRWKTCITFDHTVLHFHGTADRVDHAAKLDQSPVARALHGRP
jgi:hypothetical protein